jgi:hypothetical protein
MSTSLKNAVIELAYGKSIAFRNVRNACLVCTEGALWLTLEGEFRDLSATVWRSSRDCHPVQFSCVARQAAEFE